MVESGKDKAVNPAPGNKGAEAAEAALEMIDLMDEVPVYDLPSPQELLSHLLGNGDDDDDDDLMDYLPRGKGVKKKVVKKGSKK